MDPKKKILEQRGAEVTKAGRMFFNAIFGDSEKFVRDVGEEGDRERSADGAITVEGHPSDEPKGKAK
jgi:hypothetical protein